MIEVRRHRQAVEKIRHSAHVIVVKMGDQQRVDPLDPGVFGRRRDPYGVPAAEACVPCIDQQGLPRRRDHQGRLPALRVDEIQI